MEWLKCKISSKFAFNHLNSKLTFLLLNHVLLDFLISVNFEHLSRNEMQNDLLALAHTHLNHMAAIGSEATGNLWI